MFHRGDYDNTGYGVSKWDTKLEMSLPNQKNGILLPKLFWPIVRKKNVLVIEKVRTIFGNRMLFRLFPGDFSDVID